MISTLPEKSAGLSMAGPISFLPANPERHFTGQRDKLSKCHADRPFNVSGLIST